MKGDANDHQQQEKEKKKKKNKQIQKYGPHLKID